MSRDLQRNFTRRRWLESSAMGFGSLALATLLNDNPLRGNEVPSTLFNDLKPRSGHFPGKAKAVIQLFQTGGASQMDLFDPKPELIKRNGQPVPSSIETFQAGNANILLGPVFKFQKRGKCGMEISDVLPQLSSVADDLCMVRSMFT